MSRASSSVVWLAVILMFGVYFLPLWSISLDAPQYPEGMGMKIWLTKITGEKPHDLQNINGLNHYIGMKKIHAESIPELRYMKYVVAILIALGIGAAALRRRWALAVFVIIALGVAALGLVDFFRWGYDYGHNLNPDAPIKVPGMTYQPPLLGSKVLLNITATSLPAAGGLLLMIAVAAATVVLLLELRRGRRREVSVVIFPASAALALFVLTSCSPKQQPIEYGVDACTFCKMTITDPRYGAEIVTKKGRVRKYDAIECMVQDGLERFEPADVHAYLAVDFSNPKSLTSAATATYLHSSGLRSPMGLNVAAFAGGESARDARGRYPGELMSWPEVQELVKETSGHPAPEEQ